SILHTSAQCIHCVIKPRSGLPEFFCTFIYAFNEAGNREILWQDLTDFAASQTGPWMIMGDLNCVLQMEERCGSNVRMQEILPGTSMYRITRKLKRVKTCLKELNRLSFCTIQTDAQQAYQRLILAQQQVHASPNDAGTAELEKEALKNYKIKQTIYEQFLQQKAKCQWIREGDSNTAFFHRSIKQRRLQNTIYAIRDCKGVLQDNPSSVAGAFLEYYKDLLGVKETERQKVQQE
ncbi:Ribosomal RNA small subunit methyltransferase A, partial [Bienertia sinuspersici]